MSKSIIFILFNFLLFACQEKVTEESKKAIHQKDRQELTTDLEEINKVSEKRERREPTQDEIKQMIALQQKLIDVLKKRNANRKLTEKEKQEEAETIAIYERGIADMKKQLK